MNVSQLSHDIAGAAHGAAPSAAPPHAAMAGPRGRAPRRPSAAREARGRSGGAGGLVDVLSMSCKVKYVYFCTHSINMTQLYFK
jgi:hypothetical protein